MSDTTQPEEKVWEPIQRQVGERVVINGGRDYATPLVRVVPSMHNAAGDHEKALYISQGKNAGISISLASLEAILKWAKGE
jgi:hypothetical protein